MIFNGKIYRKYFISSSAYSLIMWLVRSSKNFEKNINFENMTADFLLRSQNSLR